MQIKMLLFSFPSAQVARHSQGTTFLRHIQENTRQFIILSGLIWTQVDRSGQRLRQLSYLCTVFKTHREYWQRLGIEKGPFLCTRLAQYLHSQSGMTKANGAIYSSAEEILPLSGAVKAPKQRSTAEGKVNPL